MNCSDGDGLFWPVNISQTIVASKTTTGYREPFSLGFSFHNKSYNSEHDYVAAHLSKEHVASMKCSPGLHNVHKKEITYTAKSTLSLSSNPPSVVQPGSEPQLHCSIPPLPKWFHSSIKSVTILLSDLLLAHSYKQGPFRFRVGASRGAQASANPFFGVGGDWYTPRQNNRRGEEQESLLSFPPSEEPLRSGWLWPNRERLTFCHAAVQISCDWSLSDGCQLLAWQLALFINESTQLQMTLGNVPFRRQQNRNRERAHRHSEEKRDQVKQKNNSLCEGFGSHLGEQPGSERFLEY